VTLLLSSVISVVKKVQWGSVVKKTAIGRV